MFNVLKKIKFIFYIVVIVYAMFNLEFVNAGITPNSGGINIGATSGSCGGNNCYSIGTCGVRVAMIDSKGNIVGNKIKDYWFYSEDNTGKTKFYTAETSVKGIYYYNNKRMKQDIIDGSGIKFDSQATSLTLYSIEEVAPGILHDMTYYYQNNQYTDRAKEHNTRIPNAANSIIYKIMANITGKPYFNPTSGTSGNYETFSGTQYEYINNIIDDLGIGGTVGHISDTEKLKGHYFLQVEPLISWAHKYVGGSSNSYTFFGTISEFKNLSRFPIGDNKFNSTNMDQFFSKYGVGMAAPAVEDIPKNSDGESIFSVGNSTFKWGTTSGVGFINLSEYGNTDTCSSLVTDLIDNNKLDTNNIKNLDSSHVTDDEKNWLVNYESYGFNKDTLKTYLTDKDTCPPPDCNTTGGRLTAGKNGEELKNAIKTLKDVFGLKDLSNTDNVFRYQTLLNGMSTNKSNLCQRVKCSELLAGHENDEDYIAKLFSLFPQYVKLDIELRKALGVDGNPIAPSCESVPKCPVDNVTASCSGTGSNTFTLSDSSDLNCLKNGIAYNEVNGGNVVSSSIQSSFDSEYGTSGYCRESVTFEFPTSVENVTAGTVFKWGIDDSSEKKFGTMTVTRNCYLVNYQNSIITSNWKTDRIDPTIIVKYKEAVPKDVNYTAMDLSGKLETKYKGIVMTINNSITVDGDTYHCSTNKCSNVNSVEMTATYDLEYGKEYNWYSDKSNNFKYVAEGDADLESKKSYTYVGYGLPTSFVTPTTLSGKYYGYSVDSSSTGAHLYATVEHIGTKSGTNYHFDKMVKFAINDDNDEDNSKIYYSCGFNIQNKLFQYECGDHGEVCSKTCDTPTCDNNCPDGICLPTPKGIDVVFRTVDLISSENDIDIAFPGRSGNGRERGRNWAEIADSEVAQILRNDVYSNEPMYELTLDAGTIQRIREYNSQLTNPYTDMTEYDENHGSEGNGYEGYTYSKSNGDSVLDKCRKFTSFADIINGNYAKCLNEARESLRSKSESSSATGPVASNFIKYLIDSKKITGRCAISRNTDRIKSIITGCGRDD